ncbi:MAG: iron repressor [Candidatus Bathyarchaeota archaeon B26-2]|nr:MAG: iron repressor [Candidatus Bathyarchaeota archaeon B26-2]
MMKRPLTSLRDGETGIITSIMIGSGDGRRRGRAWGLRKRLIDMGLTPGTKVTVIKSAPFRGPVEILVRGSRLALGRGMAERVYVETDR